MADPRSSGLKGSKASPGPNPDPRFAERQHNAMLESRMRGGQPGPSFKKAMPMHTKGGPNERAIQRANPNASFKRSGAMPTGKARPALPGPTVHALRPAEVAAARSGPREIVPSKQVNAPKKATLLPKPPPPRR